MGGEGSCMAVPGIGYGRERKAGPLYTLPPRPTPAPHREVEFIFIDIRYRFPLRGGGQGAMGRGCG